MYERFTSELLLIFAGVGRTHMVYSTQHKSEQKAGKVCIILHIIFIILIDHFTVVYSVTWPLCGSEAGGDLALIQTSLLLSCICA